MWLTIAFIVGAILCMGLGDLLWFVLYGIECYMNGASPYANESSIHMLWRCWREERAWILPGGRKLKGEYIKRHMGSFENGYIGEWKYKDVRENNLYEEVGDAVLPGLGHYIFTHILLPTIPLLLYLMICGIAWYYVSVGQS